MGKVKFASKLMAPLLVLALVLSMVAVALSITPATLVKPDAATQARLNEAYGQLPLSFEANQGQTDAQVKFLSRGSGYTLFLTSTEAVLVLTKSAAQPEDLDMTGTAPTTADAGNTQATEYAVLLMQLVGANPKPQVTGLDELPGKVNYFIGNDPQKWHTNVPNYARVQYQEVYPGIDLVYYGNQRQLEYDFVVAPGTDPETIRLGFEGADKLTFDDQGNLILHTDGGEVILNAPAIYQEINGAKQAIPGGYVLEGEDQVAFHVGNYDTSKSLVIDPVLEYSTYLGGSGYDTGVGIAVDASGNAYVTGRAYSTDFPTTEGAVQTANGSQDTAFVTKLNPAGNALIYSTYLGGSGNDYGFGIAVDTSGNAYVMGQTPSANFPTVSPFQAGFGGGFCDTFVTKLNSAGSALAYSSYLGGSGSEYPSSIVVDAASNAYVTGTTLSIDFPTASPLQPANGGSADAFIAKVMTLSEVWVDDDWAASSHGDAVNGHTFGIHAFAKIQDGINVVDSPGTVHVAAGTYVENITLKDGVQVLGAGATIDGGGAGSVVTAIGVGPDTVLDGFTITNGSADRGGGIYMRDSSPTVSNNSFQGNTANWWGGGISMGYSSPTMTNNTFQDNSAVNGGGGGISMSWCSPTMTNNSFEGNTGYEGSAIWMHESSPTMTNDSFLGNTANWAGGGIYMSWSSPTMTNSSFLGNTAPAYGGGICMGRSSPTMTNNFFQGNTAGWGGGIFMAYSSPTMSNNIIADNSADFGGGIFLQDSSPTIVNCIIWGNGDNLAGEGYTVTYSDIEGGYPGEGNISADPMLVDPAGGDYHLQAGSPCIDAGTNEAAPSEDIEGNPRSIDGDGDGTATTDMGAYEYVPPPPPPVPGVSLWGAIGLIIAMVACMIWTLRRKRVSSKA